MHDIKTFGLLFESLVVRDLRIYSEILNCKLFNYRDSDGLELDNSLILILWFVNTLFKQSRK